VLDQLNYQFLISQRDNTALTFASPNGKISTAVVENGGDGVGLDLAEDPVKVCRQNCVFCFVQQMPKGFRKSLYLKDEDIRLSFLYGHFSTLSSSDDAELDRVIRERLSPIHVSVHATDPEVRVKVVGNPREGHILRKIDRDSMTARSGRRPSASSGNGAPIRPRAHGAARAASSASPASRSA
jgi:NifB/MoaA-like Fe-S oxidoreductase